MPAWDKIMAAYDADLDTPYTTPLLQPEAIISSGGPPPLVASPASEDDDIIGDSACHGARPSVLRTCTPVSGLGRLPGSQARLRFSSTAARLP